MITNHLKNRETKLHKKELFKKKGMQETVDEDPELVELQKKQVSKSNFKGIFAKLSSSRQLQLS